MWRLAAGLASGGANPHVGNMTRQFTSYVCIDWSGAVTVRPAGIAIAQTVAASEDVTLVNHAGGWTREAVLDWLLGLAATKEDVLIGLDLSPTLPFIDRGAYFPGWQDSPPKPRVLWAMVDDIARHDPHLTAGSVVDHPDLARYFRRHGGREGDLFGGGGGRMRAVEQRQRDTRQARSASCFNLVGAAQVGKASLSAMRLLHRLDGRIPFWPFDPLPQHGPCFVEIYTSIAAREAGVAAGRSKIRDQSALDDALAALNARSDPLDRLDDHKTDVLVTAAWLRQTAPLADRWQSPAMSADILSQEGWTFGVY